MKILIIGITGQLGGCLYNSLIHHELLTPTKKQLNIHSQKDCRQFLINNKPDIIINTAAFHNVPLCEFEPEKAFNTNFIAVRELAILCRELDIKLITFSTDYVFNGNKGSSYIESDIPQPLQTYGVSKLSGEYACLSYAPENAYIIRTSGLYAAAGSRSKNGNFIDNRIADSKKYKNIEISCEQIVSPTSCSDLSIAIQKLIEHTDAKSGIYHLVNQGYCSWFEFTEEIYKLCKTRSKVLPINRNGLDGKMRRPLNSSLENTKAFKISIILPHWKDALKEYIKHNY
jgi:dTDP-4-dehydrorhamnose reductase